MLLLEGLPRKQYLTNTGFHKKYPIKGHIFVQCYNNYILPFFCVLALWLWRRCFLVGFTKAIVYSTSLHLLLRRRCCLCDFTRALFCNFDRICGWFLSTLCPNVWIVVVCLDGLLACFCHKVTFNQTGGYDHSVLDTIVQLTEGRSARDQPKQPPAKKRVASWFTHVPVDEAVQGRSSTCRGPCSCHNTTANHR